MAVSKKNTKQKKPAKKRAKKKAALPSVEGLYQEAIRVTSAWMRAGYSEQKVNELIQTHYERFSPPNIQFVMHEASQSIANQYARDRKSVIALHLKRYNQEIILIQDFFRDKEYESIPTKFRLKVMLGKLSSWLQVLNAKEKVLQLHSKDTQVKIYNKFNAKVKERKNMFDLSSLTLEEKIEFLNLVQKSSRSQNDLLGIIASEEKVKQITEDIEHEVVDQPNIDLIKQTNLPVKPKAQRPNETLDDITNKLKQALLKKAEEQFKKAGAKELAPTVKDQDD